MSSIIVPAYGPVPSEVLLVGEAPGKSEAEKLRPFVGRSGEAQESYLNRHGLSSRNWRLANIIPEYTVGNPDPTPEQISRWTPHLIQEVFSCEPKLIVAVGRFAMRFFLGESADLNTCHGLPHRAGAFDSSRSDRAPDNCVILPVHHPASGFYKDDLKAFINWDYSQVAHVLKQIRSNSPIDFRHDEWEGKETYLDVTGGELSDLLLDPHSGFDLSYVGYDTEGHAGDPYSLQVSPADGTGYLLRVEQPDFNVGLSALRVLIDQGTVFSCSNIVMHDFEVSRNFGLDLDSAKIFDTMYALYPLCLEQQGLKPAAYRWCGMQMVGHEDTVGVLGRELQLEYLAVVADRTWPRLEPRIDHENDGTVKICQPEPIERTARRILIDYYSEKLDKDGSRTDPRKRWKKIEDKRVRKAVESELGPFPFGSMRKLAQRDFNAAVRYSCRDADGSRRLYPKLVRELKRLGLLDLVMDGMNVLPVFEEMQCTGLPASRSAFESLSAKMQEEMWEIGARISNLYFDGRPFNPLSNPQVSTLLRRRGLKALKKTKTGLASTSKKSIEHLRYSDPAIKDTFDWRERQHTKNSFCDPILEIIPEDQDVCVVRSQDLLVSRTTTRRLAAKEPNLLAQPKHSIYGEMVRNCYICSDNEVFIEVDYSQIESRFLAHESRDPILCELFVNGRDVHRETAARIYGVNPSDVTKNQRFSAKCVNFGIAYGVGGMGLADQIRSKTGSLEWDEVTCNKLIREWMKLYKGAAAYFAEVESEIIRIDDPRKKPAPRKWTREPGVIIDCWKMPRYLPAVWSEDRKLAAEARRQAVNHRIQGGAQGLLQNSMRYLRGIIKQLQRDGLNIKWALQIHDSLLFIIAEELYDMLFAVVSDAMVNHCGMTLRVPIVVEGSMARTWGGLH